MTEEKYNKIADAIRKEKYGVEMINILTWAITIATVLAYVLYLIGMFFYDKTILYRSILVPAIAFAVVTIYRKNNHSKRPYEELNITPLIKKETVEKSFPSRHVFSIFMIAVTFVQTNILLAVIYSILGVILAIIRVCAGVHYPKDVIAGAATALLCGFLGYGMLYLIH